MKDLLQKTLFKKKLIKHLITLSISISGAGILIYKEGWLFLLGLILLMWGNNISNSNKES